MFRFIKRSKRHATNYMFITLEFTTQTKNIHQKDKEFWFYQRDKVFIEFLEVIGLNVLITIIVPVDY